MAVDFDAKLRKLGVLLPEANTAAANYLPFLKQGELLYISGQTCKTQGKVLYSGVVGDDFTPEQGYKAAQLCMLNVLAQVKIACDGSLNKVKQCIRLNVYIQCHADFSGHAKVANGASDLVVGVFGENGKHVRSAIGSNALPAHSTVEIDAVFAVEE